MGALTQPTGLALASSCFDKDNLGPFRRLIVTVSLSTAAFWYVSYRLVKPYAIDSTRTLSGRFDQGPEPLPPLRTVCGQLLSYRNFQSYVWAAFLMAACSTVANDFLRLVVGELVDGGAVARLAPISQPIAGMVGMLFKILLLRTSPSTTWRVALCVTLVTCGAALAAQLSVPEAAAPSSQATGWMWWKQPKAAPVEPPIFSSLSPQLAAFVPLLAPLLFFVPGGAFGRDEAKSDLIAEDRVPFSRPTLYRMVHTLYRTSSSSRGPHRSPPSTTASLRSSPSPPSRSARCSSSGCARPTPPGVAAPSFGTASSSARRCCSCSCSLSTTCRAASSLACA